MSERIVCNGCKGDLEGTNDSVVVSFGSVLYHVDCFRCQKCTNLVEHEANLLLLSDGSPVCQNCAYICSLCQKAIIDEAIVTGDESYHNDCFKCRSCHNRIHELVFAKTSQGIYCMSCHNERVSRSRRHAEARRNKSLRSKEGRNSSGNRNKPSSSTPLSSGQSTVGDYAVEETKYPVADTGLSIRQDDPALSFMKAARDSDIDAAKPISAMPQQHPPSTLPIARTGSQSLPSRSLSDQTVGMTNSDHYSSKPTTSQSKSSLLLPTSAKPEKAANRRSGFYGRNGDDFNDQSPMLRNRASDTNAQYEEEISVIVPNSALSDSAVPATSSQPISDDSRSRVSPTKASKAMSFYDPDLLAAMGSHEQSAIALPAEEGSDINDNIAVHASSPQSMPAEISDALVDEGPTGEWKVEGSSSELEDNTEDYEELANSKLRESLVGAASSASDAMTLDVKLVESLIADLETTKNRMKTLQLKYNTIKRASTQYIEGLESAKHEAGREAALRHETEAEMIQLKNRLKDQATRLSSIDQAKKAEEELHTRSNELRSSINGMEVQLADLQAERDLTRAELEELRILRLANTQADRERLEGKHLSSRLEEVKNGYRYTLGELAKKCDEAQRALDELATVRDLLSRETADLEMRKSDLHLQTASLLRDLEAMHQEVAVFKQSEHSPQEGARPLLQDKYAAGSIVEVSRIEQIPVQAKKFKWGKSRTDGKAAGKNAPSSSSSAVASLRPTGSMEWSVCQHVFHPVSLLRPVKCQHCHDKLWGIQELRCAVCGIYCHTRCQPFLNAQAQSTNAENEEVAKSGSLLVVSKQSLFATGLVEECALEGVLVPSIVSQCIDAVERYGMDFEGIYRKTGGMSQVKQLTASFEHSAGPNLQTGEWDIAAITSVMKSYFRGLPEPLFTFQLHDQFVAVAETHAPEDNQLRDLQNLILLLPDVHFAVLRLVMTHLYKIQQLSQENRMTAANLGVVFSPTLLRSADPGQEFNYINHRAKVVELCIQYAPRLFSE